MKNILIVLIVLALLGGAYAERHKLKTMLTGSGAAPTSSMSPQPSSMMETTPASGSSMQSNGQTKDVSLTAKEFAFSPKTITVSKGDMVKVTLTNNGTYPHNFTLTDFQVSGTNVAPGQTGVFTFTAEKTGSFTFFCSVPGHKDRGMTGTLIVQ